MRKINRKHRKTWPFVTAAAVLILAGGIAVIVPILEDDQEIMEEAAEYAELADKVQQDHSANTLPAFTVSPQDDLLSAVLDEQEHENNTPAYEQVHPPNEDVTAATPTAAAAISENDPAGWNTAAPQPAADTSTQHFTAQPGHQPTGRPDAAPTAAPTAPPAGNTGADLAACLKKNPDFVAWLKIPGTNVNYPVVLSDDTDYYLTHRFTGKQSKLGTLFSLEKTDYETPGRNIAIYGHHITNTSSGELMFRPLLSYKKQSFYEKHSTIYLDSLYHSAAYKIFAVVNLVKGEWDPSTASFASDADFLTFIRQAQARSLYDTGVEVTAADRILTLITCDRSYAAADGRLIVLAVEQ